MEYSSLKPVTVGQKVIIATTIQNYQNDTRDFAAIVEVRDSNGFTELLSWQTGHIGGRSSSEVGVSWIPQKADDYQIRAFVLNRIENPEVLSPVIESDVTIDSL